MKALLDGDMLIYRAAASVQTVVDLDDGLGALPMANTQAAVARAVELVTSWTKNAGCKESVLVLSSVKSDSFRHKLWKPYKEGRGEKPVAYHAVREAVSMEYETLSVQGLEADDLMGIMATAEPDTHVIVSGDKDMLTVPARVYNPLRDGKPVKISKTVADQLWLKQTMVGDAIDNYPGIPGMGPTFAQALLTEPKRLRRTTVYVGKRNPKAIEKWVEGEPCSLWQAMIDRAEKAGMTEDELIVQAQLSRILRHGEFNFDTRTVRLWHPGGYREMTI